METCPLGHLWTIVRFCRTHSWRKLFRSEILVLNPTGFAFFTITFSLSHLISRPETHVTCHCSRLTEQIVAEWPSGNSTGSSRAVWKRVRTGTGPFLVRFQPFRELLSSPGCVRQTEEEKGGSFAHGPYSVRIRTRIWTTMLRKPPLRGVYLGTL